ncbi:MAG TPA: F0F1 ATP synthase subunit delta [Burkholderiales bacterium]|nr:F0F1 ATP synthase subunit delta [Burkholderiales bacterium]
MADKLTIARPYARAAFEEAQADQRLGAWSEALRVAAEAVKDPRVAALLAGEVPVMFGGNSVTAHIKAGRLRGLAVAGKKRSPAFPDLPTLSEFYPGLEVTAWIGIFAPSGVPAPVLARLHEEINRLLSSSDLRDKVLAVGGLEPFISTREEFAALIRAEYSKYGEVVRTTKIRID